MYILDTKVHDKLLTLKGSPKQFYTSKLRKFLKANGFLHAQIN